jgi:hypothetical protein
LIFIYSIWFYLNKTLYNTDIFRCTYFNFNMIFTPGIFNFTILQLKLLNPSKLRKQTLEPKSTEAICNTRSGRAVKMPTNYSDYVCNSISVNSNGNEVYVVQLEVVFENWYCYVQFHFQVETRLLFLSDVFDFFLSIHLLEFPQCTIEVFLKFSQKAKVQIYILEMFIWNVESENQSYVKSNQIYI